MPEIHITVKNKIATHDDPEEKWVCGNGDYTVVFDLDEEWQALDIKTARFYFFDGTYTDVVFTGNTCPAPVLIGVRSVKVGLFAGDLHTTTPALVFTEGCILCLGGRVPDPPPEVYQQLIKMIDEGRLRGEPGKSFTYDMFTKEQLEALKGRDGKTPQKNVDYFDGKDGKSAYQTAKESGYKGTEKEFGNTLANLTNTLAELDRRTEVLKEIPVPEPVNSLFLGIPPIWTDPERKLGFYSQIDIGDRPMLDWLIELIKQQISEYHATNP